MQAKKVAWVMALLGLAWLAGCVVAEPEPCYVYGPVYYARPVYVYHPYYGVCYRR
jgi:hypothetical protein